MNGMLAGNQGRVRLAGRLLVGVFGVLMLAVGIRDSNASRRASGALAFLSDRGGSESLYLINADGGGLRKLIDRASEPSWSPSGRALAFLHEVKDDSPLGSSTRLDVLDADGSGRTHPVGANPSSLSAFSWSPDESRIAYEAIGDAGIYVTNVDGSGERLLVSGIAWKPAWSPDGSRIVFIRRGGGGDALTVINADGTNERQLTTDVAFSVQPAWSPDGSQILFGRENRTGDDYLYVADANGTVGSRIATTPLAPSFDSQPPQWSPDGRFIAFVAITKNFTSQTFVVRGDGSGLKVVDKRGAGTSWSPDGTTLAIVRDGEIWAVAADGTRRRRVTQAARYGYQDSSPQWHPRGERSREIGGVAVSPEIRSDSIAVKGLLLTRAPVERLAADGGRVAVAYEDFPNGTDLWKPRQTRPVRFPDTDLSGDGDSGLLDLAVAGTRVAWLTYDVGADLNLNVATATVARRRARGVLFRAIGGSTCLPRPTSSCSFIGDLRGGGGVLVFDTWQCAPSPRQPTCAGRQKLKGTLWRIQGNRAKAIRSDTRGLTPLGTNGRKIAALRGDGKVVILGSDGRVFGTTAIPGTTRGAALDSRQLVVLTPTRLFVYRLQTMALERSWALARTGAVPKLAGIGGGFAAYTQGGTIRLVRLGDGRRRAINVPGKGTVRAALTGAGLFYTYTLPHSKYPGRVAFISLRHL